MQVVDYDSRWPALFVGEATRLRIDLRNVSIHHIGSTSVPGLCAKPVLDILVEASALGEVGRASEDLRKRGYQDKGEYGIPGRRYFSRPASESELKIHLHAFQRGDDKIAAHLQFRDYLWAHPEVANRYGALKRRLAKKYALNRSAYQSGKAEFIHQVLRAAANGAAELT